MVVVSPAQQTNADCVVVSSSVTTVGTELDDEHQMELTVEVAKKILAAVVSGMQDAIRRGDEVGVAADSVLRGWGLANGRPEFEACLQRCLDAADADAKDVYLRSWLSLYREVVRTAQPLVASV
eukprot:TRINITY_DN51401_c0_g1_i1.p1 TRINITY_DN51401_c0_g1~~TRINITY_DN51401_c0_g1_i1.p1  ORF type:complete len:124 (+),score=28.72 TRINITY_DN51401_c0_g1_i1:81-452(+)